MTRLLPALLVGSALVLEAWAAEPTFLSLAPVTGPAGTTITLTGTGLDPDADYGVTVNETAASVVSVTETTLVFTLAAGSTTGPVVLTTPGEPIPTGFSFNVRRSLPGVLRLPRKVDPAGYRILVGGSVIEPNAQGQFTTPVLQDRASMVMAFREPEDPVFLAVAHSGVNSLVIDSDSTARAVVFLVPFLATRDDPRARSVLEYIAGRTETAGLAGLIESISRDGVDYLSDARYQSALISAITAAHSQPLAAPSSLAGATPSSLVKEINPAAAASKVQLKHTLTKPGDNHPNHFLLDIGHRNSRNPVDWVMEVYQLSASQFPGGRTQINALTHTALPDCVTDTPGGSGFLRAELLTAKLDLVEVAANALVDLAMSLAGAGPEFSENQFLLERDAPAVYVAQSYGGNLWYGTGLLPASENQVALLNHADKNSSWARALTANIVIASVDLASLLLDLSEVIGDEDFIQTLLATLFTDVSKALVLYNNDPNGLTTDAILDLAKNAAAAIVKAAISNFAEDGIAAFLKKAGKATLKMVASTVDILGKVSALGQVLERTAGFAAPTTLAMERAVVVIGSPFEPRIRSFEPRTGRAGTLVNISGYNFPSKNEVTVKFCTFTQTITDEDQLETVPLNATLTAEILETTETSILIRVPENWETTFNTAEAFICIETAAGAHTRTTVLEDPNRVFTHIPAPKLQAITPNPTLSEGLLTFRGERFDSEGRLLNTVLIDGTLNAEILNASGSNLVARLPGGLASGSHTAQVKWGNQTSETLNFTLEDPVSEANGFADGLRITITKADWSNTPDGEISVLEALLLATGNLGRAVEQHPPDDDQVRETDHVVGDQSGLSGGPLQKDIVTTSGALSGQVVAVTSALPALTAGDRFDLGGLILDGGGLGAGTPGLLLDGTLKVTLEDVTFRNFSGHGLHLRNGARGNILNNIRIESCGGDGLFLDAHAVENSFLDFQVSEATGVGIHLSGAQVLFNDLALSAVSTTEILGLAEQCDSHGVLIENGAAYNGVHPGTVRNNGGHGILVTGATTDHNVIGRNSNVRPRFNDVYNNQGHGVYLTSGVNHTVVRWINPAGNTGDGIRLEGPDCSFNQCDGIFTGIDYFTTPGSAVALANGGNGIHLLNGAHSNLIGSRTPGGFGERSSLANNNGAGILIDGAASSSNTVSRCNIGDIDTSFIPGFHPNGTHGIHLRNGTHDNVLGDRHSFLDLHVSGQPDGAGILLEGAGTDRNVILGNQIGSLHGGNIFPSEGRLRVGIHLLNGPQNNTIGAIGSYIDASGPSNFDQHYRPFNVIGNATRAGILLENCSQNVIQNNFIGVDESQQNAGNRFGIEITGGAHDNRIGGPIPAQGNRINLNDEAGIALIDNPLADPARSNAILNNQIKASGQGVAGGSTVDPLTAASNGIGILFQGTTTSNRVGEIFTSRNDIDGNRIGVYFDAAHHNQLQAADIHDGEIAGIILRESMDNRIGGETAEERNLITGNGGGNAEEGGVLIAGGGGHRLQLNRIGTRGAGDTLGGNNGVGLLIQNSAGNIIGGDRQLKGNVLANNTVHGIHLTGSTSSGNIIRNNLIGTDFTGANLGNTGHGILLEDGAASNRIGGRHPMISGRRVQQMPMGNEITQNGGHGVQVDGAGTTGNSILFNSITENVLLGISLTGTGNGDMPPPIQAIYDGDSFTGTVPSLALIPVGSTIQLFCDSDAVTPEGAVFLGEATVLTGGQWFIPHIGIPPFPNLSMTATHATTGSTSPFGTDAEFNLGFKVSRPGNTSPTARDVVIGPGLTPVLPLEVGALNADAEVLSLTFDTAGTLNESTQITGAFLYLDADADGRLGGGDSQLAGPETFSEDDGSVTFTLDTARLRANAPQQWILAYQHPPGIPAGTSFSVRLNDASSVEAQFIFPTGVSVTAAPPFPVASDTLTVTGGLTLAAWKQQHFADDLSNPLISGDEADPDGDGIINIVEYALGLNPRVADSGGLPQTQILDGKLIVTYTRAKNVTDIGLELKVAQDLPALLEASGVIEQFLITDNGDGTETVTLESVRNVQQDPRLFVILQVVFGQSS